MLRKVASLPAKVPTDISSFSMISNSNLPVPIADAAPGAPFNNLQDGFQAVRFRYTQDMSENYDVTIMDGTPKEIVPLYADLSKGIYLKPGYITEEFSCPMLTIGDMSSHIGARIGSKNDWYCHCLDADAHSWRKNHPIFKGPFPVKMTVVNKPTPKEAFHFAYDYDGEIPQELPMWKVQTKGFSTDEGFRIGVIARPWGYEDSPETEFISGGVSSKSIDGVAIGRNGNFLHWGFAASPAYMTDEAQNVLANAIVYISKFNGQTPIARKYNEAITTRATIDEFKYISTRAAYEDNMKMIDEANELMLGFAKKAKEKQARGEELTQADKMYLSFTPMAKKSREELLPVWLPQFYPLFGTDEQAYARYFDENRDYFYGGEGYHTLILDEDVKSIGIPNNDLRLLDAAIKMLETGKDAAKGRRILARYTLADFPSAAEWRAWFEKNRKNMFFTEAGGWVFLINNREPGVNDYKGWEIRRKQAAIAVKPTNDKEPVAVAGSKETLQDGRQMVFVKASIHPRYHIYARLAAGSPFIPTKVDIKLPDGYERAGELQYPGSKFLTPGGTTVYENTIVFRLPIKGSGKGTIECTVSYQCCNDQICYPPTEQTVEVEVN